MKSNNNIENSSKANLPALRNNSITVCANCGNKRKGVEYDTIIAKRTFIRYEGYVGTAYDSFVTKKVFLCDVCVGKLFRRRLILGLVLSAAATLIVSLLLLWPGLNNFSGGHWTTGIIFAVFATIPIIFFIARYLPGYVRRFQYLFGNQVVELSEAQLNQIKAVSRKQAEKLAMRIIEKKTNADPEKRDLAHNVFLTPTEYQSLLKKTTTELPTKKK